MTDKESLYRDLFTRLPYGIFVEDNIVSTEPVIYTMDYHPNYFNCKPYLRPMSSMTVKEKNELRDVLYFGYPSDDYDSNGHRGIEVLAIEYDYWDRIEFDFDDLNKLVDWLNAHYFDYRGLIPKGLALEAPENMYAKK